MKDDEVGEDIGPRRGYEIGYYLLMVKIEDPSKPALYLINWPNKTTISSVDLNFLEDNYDDDFFDDKEADEYEKKKHLCVSYKAEGLNTYNLFVFDINECH